MAEEREQLVTEPFNTVHVGNLPSPISAKEITRYFESFGYVKKLYLKRRASRHSNVYLKNPHVYLIFDETESVDQIMAARPFYMGECQLFIHRCLPLNSKYPRETFFSVNKILIRTTSEQSNDILPDDKIIVDYLSRVGGHIVFYERLNEKTILVQFDDYDPVDICCLLRPHSISNQTVEVEKCTDEEQVRERLQSQQKSPSFSTEPSSLSDPIDLDKETMSTPILSTDKHQMTELQSSFNDATSRLEYKHEQLVASLTNQWKQTAKERIRLQRLTLDYKQESERLLKENRQYQKLYSESLKEKPVVQKESEQKFKQASEKKILN